MKRFISIMFSFLFAGLVFAQSAEMMDKILETEKVTFGQISYLSAVHQNLIEDDASFEDAVSALVFAGQLPEGTDVDAIIPLNKIASLYFKMWPSVKGGFMCRITNKSPRYAFKQLKEDGVISQNSDPGDYLSGFEALYTLSSCMSFYAAEAEKMSLNDVGMGDEDYVESVEPAAPVAAETESVAVEEAVPSVEE